MTFYELDEGTNGTGITGVTNLVWDANLTWLGEVAIKHKTNVKQCGRLWRTAL
jgi:hypothetical protein